MIISVNGEEKFLNEPPVSINELLVVSEVESPEMVSVLLNGKVIEREKYEDTFIAEHDEVDFLYFMGGGSR